MSSQDGNLLWFDLFRALGFSITDCMAHPGSNAGCHFTLDWAALLLSTTNCSSNLWCPESSNLRRLPLALRDVTAELQNLLDSGIIERVEVSPWVSNLMVTKKKTGGLHPCVDFRRVNEAG